MALLKDTHPHIAAEVVDPSVLDTLTTYSNKKIAFRCPKGHTYETVVNNKVRQNSKCPYCLGRLVLAGFNDLATTHPHLAAELIGPNRATEISAGSGKIQTWRCSNNPEHTWKAKPNNRSSSNSGCPACKGLKADSENNLLVAFPKIATQLADPQPDGTSAADFARTHRPHSNDKALWVCNEHTPPHTWTAQINSRTHKTNPTGCPMCARKINTLPQAPLEAMDLNIHDLFGPDIPNNIEVRLVELTPNVDPQQLRKETMKASKNGIQLIHIWSDDWMYRRDVVLATLAHKLKAYDKLPELLNHPEHYTTTRRHARALEPKRTTSAQARVFAERYHLQGFASGTYHLGLFDGDDLAALMTLRSPRNNARMKRKPGQWEIQRFCVDGPIPGAFSKLLSFAEKTIISDGHELNSWISISSADISDGGLYARNGFEKIREIQPNYWYVGGPTGNRRAPKESFQKRHFCDNPRLLWKEGWTEKQAALANGMYRVYDAGKIIWTKEINRKKAQ